MLKNCEQSYKLQYLLPMYVPLKLKFWNRAVGLASEIPAHGCMVATQQPTAHATVTTTAMPGGIVCACKDFMLEFEALRVDSACGGVVTYAGMFTKQCPYRRATGKKCDPDGKRKVTYDKKKAVNEDIAVKALATAETVREVTTSVMVANAIVIVTDLVKTIRSEVKDETLCTAVRWMPIRPQQSNARLRNTSSVRL